MEDKKLYYILLIVGLILFFIELIFKFIGAFGLILCIVGMYLIIGSIVRLIYLYTKIALLKRIDILFFLK